MDVITSELAACEEVIERGLATFVEVGQALLRIRDERLYHETHGTFEAYCRERWGFTPQHGGRLIAAAEVAGALEPMGSTPRSERIARELVPVLRQHGKDVAIEAWERARARAEEEQRPVTAEDVRRVTEVLVTPAPALDRMAVHYSSATDEWATPQDFFDVVNAEFDFELDVCALPSSAKCARYFTPEDDGLAQEWTGTCWMNPPYGSEIGDWIRKAHESAKAGATVVCLVPARVDTGWWWDHCRFGEIRFIRGRLRFGDAEAGAPFPSALVVFGREPRVVWWER